MLERELVRDEAALGRPNPLAEPARERQIVGITPEERHARMAMRVDEARHEHVGGTLVERVGRKARARLGVGKHGENTAGIDRETQAFADRDARLDGERPPRTDQGIDTLRHGKIIAVRGLIRG